MRRIATLLAAACIVTGCATAADDGPDTTEGQVRASEACTPGGLYCGGDGISGDRKVLYRCDPNKVTQVEACAGECSVRPGQNDACKGTHSLAEATAKVKAFYAVPGHMPTAKPADVTPELLERLKNPAFVPGGGGNFICAQDELPRLDVAEATRDGENALVAINDSAIVVTVRLSDLRIAGWTCGQPRHSAEEAHVAIREFYGQKGPSDWRKSSLIDKPLREALERSADPRLGGSNADPILCAQDIPSRISVDPATLMGDEAVMTVREQYGTSINPVVVSVSLRDLKIATVMCQPFERGGPWANWTK